EHIKRLNWSKLNLEFVRTSEKRLRCFLKAFPHNKFAVEKTEHVINATNNNICPFVRLPSDWDIYLRDCLSVNTRQKAKRFLRRVGEGNFRVTHATQDTFARDLGILLRLWEANWSLKSGARAAELLDAHLKMLPRLFEASMLAVPILWNG